MNYHRPINAVINTIVVFVNVSLSLLSVRFRHHFSRFFCLIRKFLIGDVIEMESNNSEESSSNLPSFLKDFLTQFDEIGKTSKRQRKEFSEYELIQRNLEIEKERLRLERLYTNANDRGIV